MSTVYRYEVYVPSSWQNLGPDAHYAQADGGFDSHHEAESHAQSLGWMNYIVKGYDATDEIEMEEHFDRLEYDMDHHDALTINATIGLITERSTS